MWQRWVPKAPQALGVQESQSPSKADLLKISLLDKTKDSNIKASFYYDNVRNLGVMVSQG